MKADWSLTNSFHITATISLISRLVPLFETILIYDTYFNSWYLGTLREANEGNELDDKEDFLGKYS